jgi:hypothetical protein
MSSAEALTALASILGATGVSGILIAYLGYRTELAKARRSEPAAGVAAGIGRPAASGADMEVLANALTLLHAAINRLIAHLEEDAKRDEIDDDIQRALDLAR